MKLSIAPIISVKNFFLELLFPIHCLNCGKNYSSPPSYLCPSCFDKIKFKIEPECAFCPSRSINGQTCPFCRQEHHLDFLWAIADYQEPIIKKMLWAFKYRFISSLKIPLGHLLNAYLRHKKLDKFLETYRRQMVVIPIPLHWRRLNWRSYNQSELLAREIANEFNLNIENDILLRTKHKKPQAELADKTARIKNAQNIFSCSESEKIKGKVIILVDDITTTGSTLDEAARILKESGAEKVIGLVVAKG
ncbi:MAG: phosphoribosyltransferase [Parcubacteria group bacterium Gr01-1014_44]|nr:MAG: phosphoribosyltransferase [Parcubacteria group bacterium Gr01-1014_44]